MYDNDYDCLVLVVIIELTNADLDDCRPRCTVSTSKDIIILTLRRPPRLLRGRGYGRHVGSVGACLQQKARGRERKTA